MNNTARGTAEMTAAMTILGTIGWFVVQSGQPALNIVFWRCVFGGATLLIVGATRGVLRGTMSIRVVGLAALGGVAIVLNWVLLFSAYTRVSIAIATALYNTQPFMLVGFGAMFFAERLTLTKLLWLGLAFGGLLLIVQTKPDAGYVGTEYVAGMIMALGAALCWAVAAIITKRLSTTPPHVIALIHVCVGIVLLAPVANVGPLPNDYATWGILVTVGVVHTGLMYTLMYSAIQKLPTHLQGALSFVYPVVAIVVDVLALGHRLHVAQLMGAIAILVAAAGMNLGWSVRKSEARNKNSHAK
jgi:drug/metabolite transporter (DMT)-like permease